MNPGEVLLDLLFPPKCPYCRRILDDARAPACPDCQSELPWLEGRAGERKIDFADGCFSPLAYRDSVRKAVLRYKFSGVRACADPFGLLLAQCVRDHLPQGGDLVTWAPLSRRRLRERGYDQARLLARRTGEALGLPAVPTLEKLRHTPAQSGLHEASRRRANVLGAYALLPGAEAAGKQIILVDDVVTTGSTLSECAGVLRQAGAARIYCVTLAQARPEEDS